jgi:hypothetical protein
MTDRLVSEVPRGATRTRLAMAGVTEIPRRFAHEMTHDRVSVGSTYCGAIGGRSAGSVTTRIGAPARYAATSSAMRCQAVRNIASVT